jgi:hypothetical protein
MGMGMTKASVTGRVDMANNRRRAQLISPAAA